VSDLRVFRDPHTGLISIKSADQKDHELSIGEVMELVDQGDQKLEEYLKEFNKGVKNVD